MTVLFKPIFALHIIKFSSCRNYWGGGQNNMFAPQYFHWGAAAPATPPPPQGSTPLGLKHIPWIAAGVQGPLKGPGSSGILDALYSAISTLFWILLWQFFHSNFQAIHHELKSTRWKFWTYRRKNKFHVSETLRK